MEKGSGFHRRLIQPFSLKVEFPTKGKGQAMDLPAMLDDMFWNHVGLQESITLVERRDHFTSTKILPFFSPACNRRRLLSKSQQEAFDFSLSS
jgi:hypothetical protein